MDFAIHHPDDRHEIARYGYDAESGYYATVLWNGAIVTEDAGVVGFDPDEPVVSILTFLAQWGFVGPEEIADAMRWLHGGEGLRGWPGRRRRRAPRRLRRVLMVIRNLERAG